MQLSKATERFISYCDKSNIQYSFYGIAHIRQSQKFLQLLRRVDNKTYRRLIHFPELAIVKGDSSKAVLVSVRGNLMLEKEEYDVYSDLLCEGYHVAICLLKEGKLYWCYLPKLLMEEIPRPTHMGLPVKDNTWMDTNGIDLIEYKKWKGKYPNLPRQKFGMIDFEKSEFKILYE